MSDFTEHPLPLAYHTAVLRQWSIDRIALLSAVAVAREKVQRCPTTENLSQLALLADELFEIQLGMQRRYAMVECARDLGLAAFNPRTFFGMPPYS